MVQEENVATHLDPGQGPGVRERIKVLGRSRTTDPAVFDDVLYTVANSLRW